MTTIEPTAPDFAPEARSIAINGAAASATENARTASCAEHVLDSPTQTTYDLAHSDAIGKRAYAPVKDSNSLGAAPAFAPFDLLHTIVGNGDRASRYARMNAPGKDAKYTTIHESLTDAQLVDHLAGRSTYAAIIVGADGLTSAACIELDADALDGARRVLQAAQDHETVAFSIAVKGAGDHDGSHTWIMFAERTQPERAAYLARQIATDAGYGDAEIWPKGNAIRLPFGVHTHTQQRGRLILQSGETYDLQDADQLNMGAAAVAELPPNSAPPELPKVEPISPMGEIRPLAKPRAAGRASLDDVKARFNAEHTLDSLLTTWGAVEVKNGYTCPCGVPHTHTPTLYISKHGRLFSYSTRCKLYTTKGYDAFSLYVKLYHNDNVIDAAKTLNPIPTRWKKRQEPPLIEPQTRIQTAEQAHDAQRKRDAWSSEATAIRENISRQAETDDRLKPCDHAVLREMLAWAAEHNAVSCWLGRATLATRTSYSLGSVKRSIMLLESYGYFESSGAGGRPIDTARRNFSRGSLVARNDPRILDTRDLPTPDLELVSGAPQAEPELWELWEACDSEASGYDLALEFAQIVQNEPEIEPIAVLQDAPQVQVLSHLTKTEPDAGGASYTPKLDQTRKRRRGALPPKECEAAAKAKRQARWRAMEAPDLRVKWIKLSRKADKTKNPSQRYALKEQVAEMEHYLALKDAELDRAMAPPDLPPPHKLAGEARPLTLAMDLSQASNSSIGLTDRVRQARDAYHARQAGAL